MKIYTKTGDKGSTSLIGGARVKKNDLRVEAYGTVDELIANCAVLRDYLKDSLKNEIITIQDKLMICASHLASDTSTKLTLPNILKEDIVFLENRIDEMDNSLPELKSFILPGGNLQSSYAHVCRTITRRAERRALSLSEKYEVNYDIIIYLNRLSDYFFNLARFLLVNASIEETYWYPVKK